MNYNICHECGERNEEEYDYCKNCGAILRKETKDEPYRRDNTAKSFYSAGHNRFEDGFPESIDGIPSDDITVFIGKKAPKIFPKMARMQVAGIKTSWCWPVAVLGILFGPLGSAIWFFYRKMYKAALVLAAIGVAFSFIGYAIGGIDVLPAEQTGRISEAIRSGVFVDVNYNASVNRVLKLVFENVTSLGTAVVTGLFSMYFYKNHAVKRIRKYRMMNTDARYYKIGLSVIGGTSSAMAIVGVLILLTSESLIYLLDTLIKLF